jgi:ABC-type Na+ efflux pump permease subunit
MSPITPSRKLEIGCDLAVALAVILTGWEMGTLLHALGTPPPKGEHRIDLVDEIDAMALILNLILPLGIVALAISTGIKTRCRTLRPLSLVLSLSALVGMFACAIGVYGLFVAMNRPINLWSRIWWMFNS